METKIFDISLPISTDLPVWPGDPPVELKQVASIREGDQANVSSLCMGVHSGTHIDAPHHFLNDGQTTEEIPLEILTGPCYVAHLEDEITSIDSHVLAKLELPENTTRILFRTSNSFQWKRDEQAFVDDFVSISADGAEWLVEHGVQLVGVDYLSVAPYRDPVPTHRTFLQASVVVVEGLDLSEVPPGLYDLYCLPPNLKGVDGAPARAILIRSS
jgi:arylformamidase